jgi:hypothetical protein
MLQFVRTIPIRIVSQKALSEKQGFLFSVAAGFSKPLDPLTGFTASLPLVDQWLNDLKKYLEFSEHAENFFEVAREFLQKKAATDGAVLESLSFLEERGWQIVWHPGMTAGHCHISHSYLIDLFFNEGYGLYSLRTSWHSVSGIWPAVSSEEAQIVEEFIKLSSTMSESELQTASDKFFSIAHRDYKLVSLELMNCATKTKWCRFDI